MTSKQDFAGFGDIVGQIEKLAASPSSGTRAAHIRAAAAAAASSLPTDAPGSRFATILGRAAAVMLSLTLATTGLAAQASLPGPVQQVVSQLAGNLGFDIPAEPAEGAFSYCDNLHERDRDRLRACEGDIVVIPQDDQAENDPSVDPSDLLDEEEDGEDSVEEDELDESEDNDIDGDGDADAESEDEDESESEDQDDSDDEDTDEDDDDDDDSDDDDDDDDEDDDDDDDGDDD